MEKVVKGKATVNMFRTNSGEGARMVIPKKIVDALQIENGDTFSQKVVNGHIEMKKTPIIDDDTVSINQYKTATNLVTRTYLLAPVVEELGIKNKDMILFQLKDEKIIMTIF